MQTLSEIRELLESAGRRPRRVLGQHFLIDANLMGKLLELAELEGSETVLEIGPGTGSLTEELLARARRVVAVELDKDLAEMLRQRRGRTGDLTVLQCDALAGKHALAPEVLKELRGAGPVHLVANLPYNVAVPIIVNCLLSSWRWVHARALGGEEAAPTATSAPTVRFDRLTVTLQRELVERLSGAAGGQAYGPATVIVALLASVKPGRMLPPQAFWPKPKVHSQMLRLDFQAQQAAELTDAKTLLTVLAAAFQQRRKQLASATRLKGLRLDRQQFLKALEEAGIDPARRPQQVRPENYRVLANALARLKKAT